MSTIVLTLTLSLFDSLSTTQQIIVFVLLLTTARPVRNALTFLAGLSAAYIACGIAAYPVIDKLRILLSRYFPSVADIPGSLYYQSELVTGIIMTAIGIWYFRSRRNSRPGRARNMVLRRLQSMNWPLALFIGIFISATSFPLSFPYFVALGKYTTLHLGLVDATGCILLYNIGYALPMIAVLVVYLIARRDTADLADTLHEKARRLNVHLTTWAFAGIGIFTMIDAGCYFTLGHALVKGRYF
jgi:cytochrome c biogenesis protein CcdA